MNQENSAPLQFKIDKLTNSIENSITKEVFETDVIRILANEKLALKKTNWQFNWESEINTVENEVYKLVTTNNQNIIQGLVSVVNKGDHIFLSLIENAKFNKGSKKIYKGVAGNLVAFCCKYSFENGYNGIVSFIAKTKLIQHYKLTLGAKQFNNSSRMYIDTPEALKLVKQYFKNFNYDKY